MCSSVVNNDISIFFLLTFQTLVRYDQINVSVAKVSDVHSTEYDI